MFYFSAPARTSCLISKEDSQTYLSLHRFVNKKMERVFPVWAIFETLRISFKQEKRGKQACCGLMLFNKKNIILFYNKKEEKEIYCQYIVYRLFGFCQNTKKIEKEEGICLQQCLGK